MVNVWALGRDPKYWDDAESFKPERFEQCSVDFIGNNFEYLPFGGGRRICPGISFGLANVYLPLAQLLYHFDWKLPNGMEPKDLNLTELVGVGLLANLWQVPTVTKYPSPFEAISPGFSEPDILSSCLAYVHPQMSDISNSLLPQNFDEKSEYLTKTDAHKMFDKMLNNFPNVFTLEPLDDQIEMLDEDDIDLDISEIQQFHESPQRDMSESSPYHEVEKFHREGIALVYPCVIARQTKKISRGQIALEMILVFDPEGVSIATAALTNSGLRSIEEKPVEHEGPTTNVITRGVACVIHLGNLESAKGTGVDLSLLKVRNSWFHSNTKAVALDSPLSLDRFAIVMSRCLHSNLEDKVHFEGGSIVVNQADSIRAYGLLEAFIWDPGPITIC
ncbi:hypothetical protein MTR67_019359 [Solanum verrucosum]|uniref:Cytochrome P450 n=1 Tax=Solanum verrucosum TaxID=315347 RepID=A0AAF0TNH7_SOLVR|nr:hypothetical protein MTR67_019359 [Solanum verrucosum]